MSTESTQQSSAAGGSSSNEGSFVTGFTVGLFAGAAGFFLFGTNKGQVVRGKLSQEWNQAKKQLAQDGVISSPDLSLRDMFTQLISTITDVPHEDKKVKKAAPKKKSSSEKSSIQTKKRRFFKSS